MKAIAGLVAGAAAAVAAMVIVGFLGSLIVPISGATDPGQGDAVAEALAAAPPAAQAVILLAWFAAAFAGAAVAKRVSGRSWPGWLIAGLLALLLAAAFLVPLPVWMQALAVVGPLIGGALADLWVKGAPAPPPGSRPADA